MHCSVAGENHRVLEGIRLLNENNIEEFGQLLFDSHESSRLHFENSTPELDLIVSLARSEPGVLGSRLTGGGFGGAAIALVEVVDADEIGARIVERYVERSGFAGDVFVCAFCDGAHLLDD